LERARLDVERHLDDLDVVNLGAHAVHAIRRRAHEHAVPAGRAGDAEQEVDHLVRADAEEDVGGRGDRAEVADQVLEGEVRGGRVPVQ